MLLAERGNRKVLLLVIAGLHAVVGSRSQTSEDRIDRAAIRGELGGEFFAFAVAGAFEVAAGEKDGVFGVEIGCDR
jgi:hypothetical protein